MGHKKRFTCAICGEKMDYAYTMVRLQGKVEKVCSVDCFLKARKNDKENSNIVGGVNRSIASYRVR